MQLVMGFVLIPPLGWGNATSKAQEVERPVSALPGKLLKAAGETCEAGCVEAGAVAG